MKLDLEDMTIGSAGFNFVRTLSVAATGGADFAECLIAARRIREGDDESWVREWAALAGRVQQAAEAATRSGDIPASRGAFLRASNYFRTAMFSLPPADPRLGEYLTLSREQFHRAAQLSSPPIEILEIPFGEARLPAYFLGPGGARRPTLIVVNGGDSTNEEMAHWVGFSAVARGWNCLVFEGPGQWSALQLNPGLRLRADYEAPVAAVIEVLLQRGDVDPQHLAIIGYSLGAQLAARAAALDPRISACICDGLVTDVNAAWQATWPPVLRKAPPAVFDLVFSLFERISPPLRTFTNHFRFSMGVTKPHEVFDGWRPFSIEGLAPRTRCPMLLLFGEDEFAQSDQTVAVGVLQYVSELTCPVAIHEFGYDAGWAASHCQVGALAGAQSVIFDWLDKTLDEGLDCMWRGQPHDWALMDKYYRSPVFTRLKASVRMVQA